VVATPPSRPPSDASPRRTWRRRHHPRQITSRDGPCCSSNNDAKERKKKGRKHAPILGDAGAVDPDFVRRYRLSAELGRGEFGVTRRCEDAATGEALACKTIRRKRLPLRHAGPIADDVRREVERPDAFEERGDAILLRLSPRRQIASLVCLLCWNSSLACTVAFGEAKLLMHHLLKSV
jgi:hypothetical protein